MDQIDWNEVESIFAGAIEVDLVERESLLAARCGGRPELRAEIESLLAAHNQAGDRFEPLALASTLLRAAVTGTPAPDRLSVDRTGEFVAHYRLEARIGAGGMGVVYRARDVALGREAAVKLLPDSFTPALRAGLFAEAAACARLQHPAIATPFESGEVDGTAFIAMEFVHGETLRERLRRGALSCEEAEAIASSILEGLVHAHAAGIVHGDIKPENVMLPAPGTAKLLDFGLAQYVATRASALGASTASTTGRMDGGTIGYMSPEQVRREPLDVRSDVFQVGALLYEMLSGHPAFGGASVLERFTAVLTTDPPPLGQAAPRALGELVMRALSRQPDRRTPTAAAFLSELAAIGGGTSAAALPHRIAIFDLENQSEGAEDEWIGSALIEALRGALSEARGVTFAPDASVRQTIAALKSRNVPMHEAELGVSLGCRWVLKGGYRHVAPALLVHMQLIEAATGRVAASPDLHGTVEQIFDLQDRLVALVLEGLRVNTSLRKAVRPQMTAYAHAARAQRLFRRLEKGSMDQAWICFQEAIQIEPDYAPALAGLASISAMRFTYTSDPRLLDLAIDYARRAIANDPASADPHVWLGYALMRQDKLAEADRELRAARDGASMVFWGFYFGSVVTQMLGRNDEALVLAQRATELEPKAVFNWLNLGYLHMKGRRYGEALSSLERASQAGRLVDAQPFPDVSGYVAECLRRTGRLAEAQARGLTGLDAIESTDHMYRDSFRVHTLVTLGRVGIDRRDLGAARAAFAQAIAHVNGRPQMLAGGTLMVRALAGLAEIDGDARALGDAHALFNERRGFDFSWLWHCETAVAQLDLDRASHAVTLARQNERRHS